MAEQLRQRQQFDHQDSLCHDQGADGGGSGAGHGDALSLQNHRFGQRQHMQSDQKEQRDGQHFLEFMDDDPAELSHGRLFIVSYGRFESSED
ncbi:hypothetical protein FQZ97_925010 [compost metagenome]